MGKDIKRAEIGAGSAQSDDPGGLKNGASASPLLRDIAAISLPFEIEEAGLRASCAGDIRSVNIATKRETTWIENTLDFSHEGILRFAFKLFKLPGMVEIFPQLRLPEEASCICGIATSEVRDKQSRLLKSAREEYQDAFGEPDPYGTSNVLGSLTLKGIKLNWGDVTIHFGKRTGHDSNQFILNAPGPISLPLLIDVCIGFVADVRTTRSFSHYSAGYLRRWGEESFQGTGLKSGIPLTLTKDVKLKEVEEDEDEPSWLRPEAQPLPEPSKPPTPLTNTVAPAPPPIDVVARAELAAAQQKIAEFEKQLQEIRDKEASTLLLTEDLQNRQLQKEQALLSDLEKARDALARQKQAYEELEKEKAAAEQQLQEAQAQKETPWAEWRDKEVARLAEERVVLILDPERRAIQAEYEKKSAEIDEKARAAAAALENEKKAAADEISNMRALLDKESEEVLTKLDIVKETEARIGRLLAKTVIGSSGVPRGENGS